MNIETLVDDVIRPEFREIAIAQLVRGQYQPRREFDKAELEELAGTIKTVGILQYLLVRPIPNQNNLFEIIAGERRWRAAQIIGFEKVPCLIGQYSNEVAAQIALIENTARKNLSPIEAAEGIEKLIAEFDYTHEEAASILGKPRTQITNLLRLLKLDPRVRLLLSKGDLSESHGKTLAGISKNEQFKYARDAIAKSWSVGKLEKAIKKELNEKKKLLATTQTATTSNPHLERLKRKLSEHVAAPVLLDFDDKTQQNGYIKIRFTNLDEFEGILERVGYRDE
jgi:ParB family chromosome partitioning protein